MLVTKLQAADLMGVSTEWVSMMISTKALTPHNQADGTTLIDSFEIEEKRYVVPVISALSYSRTQRLLEKLTSLSRQRQTGPEA
ncbi:MAG TPA: hypothetical protein GXX56_05135 [Rhodocyclaceae bacterium]|nr:hypothetical protein [Rhodocyclaceae bacterium]